MANPVSSNPRVFGQIVVPAPGTLVRVTSTQTDPSQRVGLQSITFQARPANAGIVYIRMRGDASDDRTNRLFTLGILAHPTSATDGPFDRMTVTAPPASGGLNAADFYLDAASAGDGALVFGIAG